MPYCAACRVVLAGGDRGADGLANPRPPVVYHIALIRTLEK